MLIESCIYGDYRGRFQIDAATSLSCSEIGVQQPWRCYDNSYVTDCCQTCADVRNTSLPVGAYHDVFQSIFIITSHFICSKITVKAEVGTYSEQDSKAEH